MELAKSVTALGAGKFAANLVHNLHSQQSQVRPQKGREVRTLRSIRLQVLALLVGAIHSFFYDSKMGCVLGDPLVCRNTCKNFDVRTGQKESCEMEAKFHASLNTAVCLHCKFLWRVLDLETQASEDRLQQIFGPKL